MTETRKLLELADRVEKLAGPDDSMNVEIFRAIGTPLPREFMKYKLKLEWNEADRCFMMPVGEMRIRYIVPAYTESIEAAMTLVPKKHAVVSMKNGDLDHKYHDVRTYNIWKVTLARDGWVMKTPLDVMQFPTGTGFNCACALTAASLRARASAATTKEN